MLKKLLDVSACVFTCALVLGVVACSDDNTAGITEDGNPIAHGESSSSVVGGSSAVESSSSVVSASSAAQSSSSVVAVQSSSSVEAVPKFDVWNGKTDYKINTGNENTGYWFSYGDDAEGGLSTITWPVPMGNEYSDNTLDAVIEECGGLCGTVELRGSETMPWAGIGFTLAEEGSTVDISAWGGICVTYASEYPVNFYLNVDVGGIDTISNVSPFMAYPMITLPKTVTNAPTLKNMLGSDVAITRCAKWSDFKVSSWAEYNKAKLSKVYSGEEAAKEIKAINFVFMGNSDGKGNFNIIGVSTYDENLPQLNRNGQMNERDADLVNTNNDSLTCLWKGLDGSGIVNTGYNDRGEFVGMLYDVDASPEGAYSKIEFPADMVTIYEPYMYETIIYECKGFCGTMEFTLENADYAASAVAFNIAEDTLTSCEGNTCYGEAKFADIKDWGGICITYYTEKDAYLNVVVKDVPYENSPKASLPASGALVEKCFTWNDFAPNDPNMGSAVSVIQFIVKSYEDGDRNQFNIAGIGKYSANGACSIPKTTYTPKSSSSRTPRSSSIDTTKHHKLIVEEQCALLSKLWCAVGNANTGYNYSGNDLAGRWYRIEDTSDVNKSSFTQPLTGKDSIYLEVNGGVEFPDSCAGGARTGLYDGLCGTAVFKDDYFAGLGFYVAGFDHNDSTLLSGDVEESWGGICVTYASEADIDVVMNSSGVHDISQLPKLPKATLSKSSEVVTRCLPWNEFKSDDGKFVDPKTLTTVNFVVYGEKGTRKKINIHALGKYSAYAEYDYSLKCPIEEHFVSGN